MSYYQVQFERAVKAVYRLNRCIDGEDYLNLNTTLSFDDGDGTWVGEVELDCSEMYDELLVHLRDYWVTVREYNRKQLERDGIKTIELENSIRAMLADADAEAYAEANKCYNCDCYPCECDQICHCGYNTGDGCCNGDGYECEEEEACIVEPVNELDAM